MSRPSSTPAAVRWHARWLQERPDSDLADSALVLAALGALKGAHGQEGMRVLRRLVQAA